ncbi:MAG: hypothetical protein K2G01_01795, partial [Paramuribaculum sp.]|nr:hypothetical protein [Paramuribaculum sp.]
YLSSVAISWASNGTKPSLNNMSVVKSRGVSRTMRTLPMTEAFKEPLTHRRGGSIVIRDMED